jgi:hypothetical protein
MVRMTNITFTRSYRGRHTGERFFEAGVGAEGAATVTDPSAKVDQPVPQAPNAQERRAIRDGLYWRGSARGRWK